MARPMYECSEDWKKERAAISVLEEHFKAIGSKLPISYGVDYALVGKGDRILAFFEVKSRCNHSDRYESLFISALKRMKALELSAATGRPCYILAGYTDGIYLINFDEKPFKTTLAGRTDRGDSADMEPCVHYSKEQMKLISNINVHELIQGIAA